MEQNEMMAVSGGGKRGAGHDIAKWTAGSALSAMAIDGFSFATATTVAAIGTVGSFAIMLGSAVAISAKYGAQPNRHHR